MDRSKLNELQYKAQLGKEIVVDNFDLAELVLNSAKVEEIQSSLSSNVNSIINESGDIEDEIGYAKGRISNALELMEANREDFPEVFFDTFKESLDLITEMLEDIESSNDNISESATALQNSIYNEN